MGRLKRKRALVLQVSLEEELVEGRAGISLWGRAPREDLRLLTRAIRRAAEDRRVGGLLLRMAHSRLSWAKAATLARAVQDFRATGKPTLAFLEGAGNIDFTVACACETLLMPPGGTLYLNALQAEVFFFKDLLDWVGIEAEIDSVGEYKSAGEMFVRREMSGPHREEVEALLEDLSDQMTRSIAEGRSLELEKIPDLLEKGPFLADEAAEAGLIDQVIHEDACKSILSEKLGAEAQIIPSGRYRGGDGLLRRLFSFRRPRVAVVYAVGIISQGEDRQSKSPRPIIGAKSLCQLIERIRNSPRIKALVLRIDSPGGSAVASEIVWREVELTRKEKPVVVSMGDVAASGGYYIATAADAILAEPSTLTGSIGIVGGKAVARRLLDKLGVHRETLSLGSSSGYLSPFHPFTEAEREKLRSHLRYFYEKLFLPRVAEGRNLSLEQVHEVARGRVWTGRQSKERGLVDALGDLDAAIELACRKAKIPPKKKVKVVGYMRRSRLRDIFSFGLPWNERAWGADILGPLLEHLELLSREEALFLMPFFLRIK